MKPALLPITMAVAAALTVAAVSSRAQAPGVYALHEVPEGATLHKVTADPALVDRTKRFHILRSHLATPLLLVESGQALGSAYAGGKRLPSFLRSFAGGDLVRRRRMHVIGTNHRGGLKKR